MENDFMKPPKHWFIKRTNENRLKFIDVYKHSIRMIGDKFPSDAELKRWCIDYYGYDGKYHRELSANCFKSTAVQITIEEFEKFILGYEIKIPKYEFLTIPSKMPPEWGLKFSYNEWDKYVRIVSQDGFVNKSILKNFEYMFLNKRSKDGDHAISAYIYDNNYWHYQFNFIDKTIMINGQNSQIIVFADSTMIMPNVNFKNIDSFVLYIEFIKTIDFESMLGKKKLEEYYKRYLLNEKEFSETF